MIHELQGKEGWIKSHFLQISKNINRPKSQDSYHFFKALVDLLVACSGI